MTSAVNPMVVHHAPPAMMKAGAAPASLLATEAFTKDAILAWYRGEFAAANAIIDALCGHISEIHGGETSEYTSAFAEIHRRRMNWIPILQKQKFYPIADVERELRNVAEAKRMRSQEEPEDDCGGDAAAKEVIGDGKAEADECLMSDEHSVDSGEPQSDVTDSGSQDTHTSQEQVINICSNHDQCEARSAQIKITKGFVAKEPVKGHMVNVARGLKLYEDVFTEVELSKLNDFVNELHVAGQNGELTGETFILYNQQMKGNKRELIQLGVPIFRQIKEDSKSNIEPIPSLLQGVIAHLIQWRLIPESKKPNSCIINFFDEGEYSQPFVKPPHLEQPLSTLVLSESKMVFGRMLTGDDQGHYRGPLTIHLKEGSLLVMRGKSSDTARHAMCSSQNKRVTITFFRVWTEREHNNLTEDVIAPSSKAMTLWKNSSVPTQYMIPNNLNPVINVIPAWGLLQAPVMTLAPVHQVMANHRTGGTGVFLPSNAGSRKHARHLPPRALRSRRLALTSSRDERKAEPLSSDSGN